MKYFTRFTIYNTVYCIRNFLILNPKIRPTSLDTVINHDRIHFPNLCPFHKTFLRFVHKYFFLQYNTLQWTQQRKKCFAFQFFFSARNFFPLMSKRFVVFVRIVCKAPKSLSSPLSFFVLQKRKKDTVFENHIKSLIQHCERSELR